MRSPAEIESQVLYCKGLRSGEFRRIPVGFVPSVSTTTDTYRFPLSDELGSVRQRESGIISQILQAIERTQRIRSWITILDSRRFDLLW
jgi:hypothetical protein